MEVINDSVNALIKIGDNSDVVVAEPFNKDEFHNKDDIDSLIVSARKHVEMRSDQFCAIGEIVCAPTDALKEMKAALKADDDTLKNYDSALREELLKRSGFMALSVQIKGTKSRIDPISFRGRIQRMIKEIDAELESRKPKPIMHTYAIQLTCSDAVLEKIVAKAEELGAEGVLCASPQSDAETKKIVKWFNDNA